MPSKIFSESNETKNLDEIINIAFEYIQSNASWRLLVLLLRKQLTLSAFVALLLKF